jgi:hypothetical protein
MNNNNKPFRKAQNRRDQKAVYNQYSDFSKDIPNLIKVGQKYQASGNVCLGVATNAKNWKPWRFGKPSYLLHPMTVIQIGKINTIYLSTALVCDYLRKYSSELRELESGGFNGLKTRSFIVKIKDLENFCNNQALPVAA